MTIPERLVWLLLWGGWIAGGRGRYVGRGVRTLYSDPGEREGDPDLAGEGMGF